MHAQTPVQIAWETRDVHFASDTCTHRGESADFVAAPGPENFAARRAGAKFDGIAVLSQSTMSDGSQFGYLCAPVAAVPYLDIAGIPSGIQSFFDYVEQEQA